MSKTLITGASGFVGRNLVRFFLQHGSVIETDARTSSDFPNVMAMDVCNPEAVNDIFARHAPGVVIHAAGIKDVRFCEKNPAEAHRINGIGTGNIAAVCKKHGARLIYLSTDLVFDSYQGHYNETDTPRPSLAYGQAKYDGELLALEQCPDAAICRSGGIYGSQSPLLKWLRDELQAGKKVQCYTDVYNSPTYVDNLAEMMLSIIRQNLSGVFHTVGSQRVNRYEFFDSFRKVFALPDGLLEPKPGGSQRDAMLLRPDSSLNFQKTASLLKVNFDSPETGFGRLKLSGVI